MTKNEHTAPEEFIEQVKDALSHLYNIPELLKTPFALNYPADNTPSLAHQLRRELMEAIESLNPGKQVSMRSNAARLYNLMHLHYVGDMTLQETANELGISLRQAYRDLRRGQENIASILWYKRNQEIPSERSHPDLMEGDAHDLSSIESEITLLERNFTVIDITTILDSATRAVQRLAEQKHVELHVNLPDEPVQVSTHKAIAQQVLINLLSQAIQHTSDVEIVINLLENRNNARLHIEFASAVTDDELISPVIARLMAQVKWSSEVNDGQLTIHLNSHGSQILIIDDNEGLVDLLHHYVSDNVYQVYTANNGVDGLRIASELQPDAIVMDLMMPDMDGWELLQHLRTDDSTRDIPVVICSVIHDPELAYSLGANEFIAKPVNKDQLLNTLKKLNI